VDRPFVAAVAFYVASVLFISIMIAGYATAVRDISWIEPVENYIRKEWRHNATYYGLEFDAFFLYENGEEKYFVLSDSQQEFIAYMKDLSGKVDKQLRISFSKESVDEILAADKVLEFVHRFPEGFGHFGLYGSAEVAYFILEDKLGMSMEGAIIMQDRRAGEYSQYSLWQITNWVLW